MGYMCDTRTSEGFLCQESENERSWQGWRRLSFSRALTGVLKSLILTAAGEVGVSLDGQICKIGIGTNKVTWLDSSVSSAVA